MNVYIEECQKAIGTDWIRTNAPEGICLANKRDRPLCHSAFVILKASFSYSAYMASDTKGSHNFRVSHVGKRDMTLVRLRYGPQAPELGAVGYLRNQQRLCRMS